MATTKITSPELFDLGSLNTALQLPSGTTAQRPTSPSTGEWRYNTDNNLIEFYDGGAWRELQDEDIPPVPSEHFNTVLYTGNSSTQSITGVGFQPDFIWIKRRNSAESHAIYDSTRGINKQLESNSTAAEATNTAPYEGVNSFDSDGFTTGDNGGTNRSPNTYVAWCWKANGGTTVSNGEGSVTSTVQANTKAGFSVVTATAPSSGVFTVGHGLNAEIDLFFVKRTDSTGGWITYARPVGANKYMLLNDSAAAATSTSFFDNTDPTSSVFTLNAGSSVVGGANFVAYCFHSVAGYSKIGSYTGNGSSNGPLINTGFEPAFLIIKRTDTDPTAGAGGVWIMYDNKRNPSNPRNTRLWADNNAAEFSTSQYNIDFLSNGFQPKDGTAGYAMNTSGGNYIYMAFASDPSSAPTLANSFTGMLYNGTSQNHSIQGLGFSPSLVWTKDRGNSDKLNSSRSN